MACSFIAELSKLRKLSVESVENTNSFDDFKRYMHVLRPVETELRMESIRKCVGICRRSSPSRQILILCWATPSRAESRKRSVEVMKTRSKATQILRANMARRYGFGASPNK